MNKRREKFRRKKAAKRYRIKINSEIDLHLT